MSKGDLISRSELIEALNLRKLSHENDFEKFYDSVDAQLAIARVIDELEHIVEIVKAQPKGGEWIPCSERLPEVENKQYLIYLRGLVLISFWTKAGWNTYKNIDGTYDTELKFDDVIAWQPLPEPYREKVE